jgi:heavy metal translocating P-type ATPase
MSPLSADNPWLRRDSLIAALALSAVGIHLVLRFIAPVSGQWLGVDWATWPLIVALLAGGIPLVVGLLREMIAFRFGSDLLAGMSIITALVLGEYLAGVLVVLMLSGGQTLEAYAVRSASSALAALARRMPTTVHRRREGGLEEIAISDADVGDLLVVFPHETCPVDGVVVEGRSEMNEAYLTGEPYMLSKTVGSAVLSGAVNGEGALTVRAEKRAVDSRYAKIMQVMRESEQRRPRLRRLGDQLGAIYTPVALTIAVGAWLASGDPVRFLAVLVVATPCPLLIAIPVAVIGSVSLAARRGIVIKDPAILEKLDSCRTAIFDKTGTLTYGEPRLTEILPADGIDERQLLQAAASLERYSRHPLSAAVLAAASSQGIPLIDPSEVSERPGEGLRGIVEDRVVEITSRKKLLKLKSSLAELVPPTVGGLECVVLIDSSYAGAMRFRDEPRAEGRLFVEHLSPKHAFNKVMIVSGDREEEVRYLADKVGIREVFASQTPEQKLELVRKETAQAPTLFMGDGINDAPALTAATVGVAFGQASEVAAEAAGAVIMDSELARVDELFHIGSRMRRIALQSAIGGMVVSVLAMFVAAAGYLPPVAGALLQELIDVAAVLNALRAAVPPAMLNDFRRTKVVEQPKLVD